MARGKNQTKANCKQNSNTDVTPQTVLSHFLAKYDTYVTLHNNVVFHHNFLQNMTPICTKCHSDLKQSYYNKLEYSRIN